MIAIVTQDEVLPRRHGKLAAARETPHLTPPLRIDQPRRDFAGEIVAPQVGLRLLEGRVRLIEGDAVDEHLAIGDA